MSKRLKQVAFVVVALSVVTLIKWSFWSFAPNRVAVPTVLAVANKPSTGQFYPEVPSAPLTSSIRGVVSADNHGLVGATVTLWLTPVPGSVFHNVAPRSVTYSDQSGGFSFSGLQSGVYSLSFCAAGRIPTYEGSVHVPESTTVTVDAVLGAGGHELNGTVVDFGGGNISGAHVTAMRILSASAPPEIYETETDALGTYRMTLASGLHVLSVSAAGYALERQQIHLEATTTVGFTLLPAASIIGRVTNPQGLGVPDAEVSVVSETSARTYLPVRAGEDGAYEVPNLEPGGYRLWARGNGLVSGELGARLGALVGPTKVDIVMTTGASLSGFVKDEQGQPVANARVRLQSSTDPRDRAITAMSAQDGAYRISGILPGLVALSVESIEYVTAQETLRLSANDLSHDVVVEQGAQVFGTVLAKSEELRQTSVSLTWRMEGGSQPRVYEQQPGKEGKFQFVGLPPGSGTVLALAAGQGQAEEAVPNLRAGQRHSVTLAIRRGGTWLSGTVRDSEGNSAENVTVIALEPSPSAVTRTLSSATNRAGSFRIGPFSPGQVLLVASPDGSTGWGLGVPSNDPDRATVTVDADVAEVPNVNLRLPRAALPITGRVTDASGNPIPDATVTVVAESYGPSSRRATGAAHSLTAEDGTFRVKNQREGKYTVWASAVGYADAAVGGITPGAEARVVLSAPLSVTGCAVDVQGKPVTDYSVLIFPGPTDDRGVSVAINDLPSRRVHDATGCFRIADLEASAYEFVLLDSEHHAGNVRTTLSANKDLGVITLREQNNATTGSSHLQ